MTVGCFGRSIVHFYTVSYTVSSMENPERIQAVCRGWLVRHDISDKLYGQSKWHACKTRRFCDVYRDFVREAVCGRVRIYASGSVTTLNAGTTMLLLRNRCIVAAHHCERQVMHVRITATPREDRIQLRHKDFGTHCDGSKRIRPLPRDNFKGMSSDMQAKLAMFMTIRDYWAFSLVSRNVYFDGRGIMLQMRKMASLRLGYSPACVDMALRGYTRLRSSVRCDWRMVCLCTSQTKILSMWPDRTCSADESRVMFVTADGHIGKTDVAYGNTQYRPIPGNNHSRILCGQEHDGRAVFRAEFGFSVLLSAERCNWLHVHMLNVHELAIVDRNTIFIVAGSSRRLRYYEVTNHTSLVLPHERVQMLKRTPGGVLCRLGTKRLLYHCSDYVNSGFIWGAERVLEGAGRIAMVSEPLVSGRNVVVRARGGAAISALVMRERRIERVVDINWTPWFRRELVVVGDMLTFHDKHSHRRLCVRPDTDEWEEHDMCVGDTDGHLLLHGDYTVFSPLNTCICALPRWA